MPFRFGGDAVHVYLTINREISFENGWITRGQLMESAERYGKGPYRHLKGIVDDEIMLVPNQKN